MKNKGRLKKGICISLIFMLMNAFIFFPAINGYVSADETIDEGPIYYREGFIVKSEKVVGKIDLMKAINGQVDIKEGVIEGLSIIKELENHIEPMLIKVESEGPVVVTNLHAETVGGEMPHIGSICGIDLGSLISTILQEIDLEALLSSLTLNNLLYILEEALGINIIDLLQLIDLEELLGIDLDLLALIELIGDVPLLQVIEFILELLGLEISVDELLQLLPQLDLDTLLALLEQLGLDLGGDFDLGFLLDLIDLQALLPFLGLLPIDELIVDVCLEDVTMLLEEQSVEAIKLPNSNIKSCFWEDCDFSIEDYLVDFGTHNLVLSSLGTGNVNEDMKLEVQHENIDFDELLDEIERDEETLNALKELVHEVERIYLQIIEELLLEKLGDEVDHIAIKLETILEELGNEENEEFEATEVEVDEETDKDIDEEVKEETLGHVEEDMAEEDIIEQVQFWLGELEEQSDHMEQLIHSFSILLDEAFSMIESLEKSIMEKHQHLLAYVEKVEESHEIVADGDTVIVKVFENENNENEETLVIVQQRFEQLEHDFNVIKQTVTELKNNEEELMEQFDGINEQILYLYDLYNRLNMIREEDIDGDDVEKEENEEEDEKHPDDEEDGKDQEKREEQETPIDTENDAMKDLTPNDKLSIDPVKPYRTRED